MTDSIRSASACRLLVLALLLLPAFAVAQMSERKAPSAELLKKCDPWLKHHLLLESTRPEEPDASAEIATNAAPELLSLFVTGDRQVIEGVVTRLGGRIGSFAGSIATVRLPRQALDELAAVAEIRRIELARSVRIDQDTARAHVHADEAHAGRAPLREKATGKGVILGIIDTGIDFRHPEFLNQDGSVRMLSIWSQTELQGTPPVGFDYGAEWNRAELDELLDGDPGDNPADPRGHGTHVAGIAAGRSGIAPDAEIIMVQFHNTFEALTTDVLDGAAYIFSRASAERKPVVINASLGTNDHFHDGSDAISRGLEALLAEKPGRIFVASAGNRGDAKWHWGGFVAEEDSLWTVAYGTNTTIRIADSSSADFQISIEVDSTYSTRAFARRSGQTAWRSVREIGEGIGFTDSISNSVVSISAASLDNGHTGVIVSTKQLNLNSNVLYRVMVRGRGFFQAWNSTFHPVPQVLDILDDRFRASDSEMLTGSPGIAEKVITVGSYVNRASFMTSSQVRFPSPPNISGARSSFSSIGPRSDGVLKPDIVAPGQNVISARSSTLTDLAGWQQLSDPLYMPNSGTSMSSPVVAGAVALYLQMRPEATVDEVREAIYRSALQDAQTADAGPLPNSRWGMGKLDLFRMLSGIPSLVPGASPELLPAAVVWTRPTPASDMVSIGRNTSMLGEGRLLVYNAMGEQVGGFVVPVGSAEIALNVAGWPAGTYYCRMLSVEGMATGRIVVER